MKPTWLLTIRCRPGTHSPEIRIARKAADQEQEASRPIRAVSALEALSMRICFPGLYKLTGKISPTATKSR